jgi:hypothetical protein
LFNFLFLRCQRKSKGTKEIEMSNLSLLPFLSLPFYFIFLQIAERGEEREMHGICWCTGGEEEAAVNDVMQIIK